MSRSFKIGLAPPPTPSVRSPAFIVMSPIIRWNLGRVRLARGDNVVQLDGKERPNLIGNIHITEAQRQRLADCEYWLIKNVPRGAQAGARPEKAAEESSVRLLQNTQIALQVLLPRVSEMIFVTLDGKSRLDLTTSVGLRSSRRGGRGGKGWHSE